MENARRGVKPYRADIRGVAQTLKEGAILSPQRKTFIVYSLFHNKTELNGGMMDL